MSDREMLRYRDHRVRMQDMFGNPPLRFDVAEDPSQLRHSLEVLLDGEPALAVSAYDAIDGWIDRYVIAPNGNVVIEGDGFKTERVHGTVEPRWRS